MIALKANLFPYRFKVADQKPVELTMRFTRENPQERFVTIRLACQGNSFSFSRENFVLQQRIDLGKVKSVEKSFTFPLYAIAQSPVREVLLISVREHEGDDTYPLHTVKKELDLILD